jgi:hypothetical protein
MKIGKLNFDELVKLSFDMVKIKFAAKGVFIALFISVVFSYVINLTLKSYSLNVISAVDSIGSFISAVVMIATSLGVVLLLKSDLAKTKKKLDLAKEIKALLLKTIGLIILFLLSVTLFLLIAAALGMLGKINGAGPYLMALFSVPAVIAFSILIVYVFVTSKLLVIAVAENPKKKLFALLKDTITLTQLNAKKIMFNAVLSLLPIFTLVLAYSIAVMTAYLLYAVFFWNLPGVANIIGLSLSGGVNLISFIVSVSGIAIVSFVLGHLLVMSNAVLYSIYLDAK